MANPTIAIELTPKERALILRYGYPFDQIKAALLAMSSSKQIETVLLDEYEVDRLIGDLCLRSITRKAGSPCKPSSMISATASSTRSKRVTASWRYSEQTRRSCRHTPCRQHRAPPSMPNSDAYAKERQERKGVRGKKRGKEKVSGTVY